MPQVQEVRIAPDEADAEGGAVRLAGYLAMRLVEVPQFIVALTVSFVVAMRTPRLGLLTLLVGAGVALVLRVVEPRSLMRWRRYFEERRIWVGSPWRSSLGANVMLDNRASRLPTLWKVLDEGHTKRLVFKLQPGNSVENFEAAASALAHGWKAYRIRVDSPAPGWVVVTVVMRDALASSRNAIWIGDER